MNRTRTIAICVAVVSSASANSVGGQATTRITLAEAVRLGQERNAESRAAVSRLEAAKADGRHFASRLRPQVQLSTTLLDFDRGINQITQPDGSQQFVGQSNNRTTATLGVSQVVSATGATLSLSSGLSRADQFGNVTSQSWQSTPVLLSLSQPLFQVRRVEWDRLESAASLEISMERLEDIKAQVAQTVATQYMALRTAELTLANAQSNAAIADTLLTLNERRYRIGSVLVLELSRTELASLRARMTVEEAQLARDRASAVLALSLGADDRTLIQTDEPTMPDTISFLSDSAISKAGRRGLVAAQFRADSIAGERRLAEARASSRLSSNLVASVGFNQKGNSLPVAYDSPLGKQRATLGLTVPLVQWGAGIALSEAARYRLLSALESGHHEAARVEQEARFAARAVSMSLRQVRLATMADSIASVQFRIARLQYSNGALTYNEFLVVQQEKDNAVLNRATTMQAFWNHYYGLRRLVGQNE